MARLVLSVGGMVLGNLILPGLGSAIGGVLGSYVGGIVDQQLFGGSPQQTVYGPRLQDLRVHSSSYGAVIPKAFDKARLGGNVIWMAASAKRCAPRQPRLAAVARAAVAAAPPCRT